MARPFSYIGEWDRRMNHFTANIMGLTGRYPELAASVKGARGEVLTIESARNGLPSARRAGRWIHSAYDPLREAATWAHSHASFSVPIMS